MRERELRGGAMSTEGRWGSEKRVMGWEEGGREGERCVGVYIGVYIGGGVWVVQGWGGGGYGHRGRRVGKKGVPQVKYRFFWDEWKPAKVRGRGRNVELA